MEQTNFKERQLELFNLTGQNASVIFSSTEKVRSNDTHYLFRQKSNLKYLIGFDEPESVLVIKNDQGQMTSHLFLREKNEFKEMWEGKVFGTQKALDILDVDFTYDITTLEETLPSLLQNHSEVFYEIFDQTIDPIMKRAILKANQKTRKSGKQIIKTSNIEREVGQLRLYKGPNEILSMKKACSISNKAHRAAMAFTQKGKNEKDILALMEYIFKKEGACSSAYEPIIAGGENALILHYIKNNETLYDNELLLIDAGCEFNGYASDITRTFPVNGKFNDIQKDIYQAVLQSQESAIKLCRPGAKLGDIHKEVEKILLQSLIDLKIIKGNFDEHLEKSTIRKYYPHGTSHWLGLDVHDECPYTDNEGNPIALAENMVLTVEPGLYFQKGDSDIADFAQGIGIRIEDDILITKNSCENLTAAVPKSITELEKACSEDYFTFLS